MYASALDYRRIQRRRPASPWLKPARNAALGLAVVVGLGMGFAQVAHGGAPAAFETITVQPGDSLWAIASRRYPNADVREKVGEIERANGLPGPAVRAGQRLQVPSE